MKLKKYFDSSWYEFSVKKIKDLGLTNNHLIFDVGAGNCLLKNKITEIGSHWKGFDVKPRSEEVIEWDLKDPIPDKLNRKPDCILLLEVIEHLLNPEIGIKNLSEAAKKGTYLIITTPNPYWSVVRIKFLVFGIFPMFEKSDLENNHHVYTAWPHVLEYLLVKNEFEIIDSYTIGTRAKFPLFNFKPSYLIKFIFYFLRKIVEKSDIKAKGMSYGVIAIKR
ncbi:hypothetical protein BH23BAC1_BH23BAC1_50840 [soil metagenome]